MLGCGRSGTSLVAGLFARTHEMGSRLLAPDPANPKGFFEDRAVNAANERLLAPYDAFSSPGRRPLREGERWLAVLAPGTVPGQRADLPPAAPPWCRRTGWSCTTTKG